MADTQATPTLPTFSWIGHLKEDDRELLSSYGEFFPAHPGNAIIEEGVLQTEVFVVVSGELEVHALNEEGETALRARLGPGETLGEVSLFDPGPALATVTASEFSQLWRIADSDLIQFMEDNPGAGNVLLRTLAAMLSQRLRQVDPAAFGLSSYAVVESPELEEQDATTSAAEAAATLPETSAAPVESAVHSPVIPLPVGDVPSTSPVIPLPVPETAPALGTAARGALTPAQTPVPSADVPLTPVTALPAGAGTESRQPAAARLQSIAPERGKMPSQTQVIPDPDELEPL